MKRIEIGNHRREGKMSDYRVNIDSLGNITIREIGYGSGPFEHPNPYIRLDRVKASDREIRLTYERDLACARREDGRIWDRYQEELMRLQREKKGAEDAGDELSALQLERRIKKTTKNRPQEENVQSVETRWRSFLASRLPKKRDMTGTRSVLMCLLGIAGGVSCLSFAAFGLEIYGLSVVNPAAYGFFVFGALPGAILGFAIASIAQSRIDKNYSEKLNRLAAEFGRDSGFRN